MLLTISRVADDLWGSGLDPSYQGSLFLFVFCTRRGPATFFCYGFYIDRLLLFFQPFFQFVGVLCFRTFFQRLYQHIFDIIFLVFFNTNFNFQEIGTCQLTTDSPLRSQYIYNRIYVYFINPCFGCINPSFGFLVVAARHYVEHVQCCWQWRLFGCRMWKEMRGRDIDILIELISFRWSKVICSLIHEVDIVLNNSICPKMNGICRRCVERGRT